MKIPYKKREKIVANDNTRLTLVRKFSFLCQSRSIFTLVDLPRSLCLSSIHFAIILTPCRYMYATTNFPIIVSWFIAAGTRGESTKRRRRRKRKGRKEGGKRRRRTEKPRRRWKEGDSIRKKEKRENFNPLRWQIDSRTVTSDRITTIRRFLFPSYPSVWYRWTKVISLSFVLPGLHLNVLEAEGMSRFSQKKKKKEKKFSTCKKIRSKRKRLNGRIFWRQFWRRGIVIVARHAL